VPVDQLIEEVAAVSGPLKKYRVTRGGVETVMKLSDDDAKRLGAKADDVVGGASTIQPVEPVQEGEADDGPADDGGGSGASQGDDAGQGAQQVQQAADDGGDGQASGATPAAADSQQPTPAPTAAKTTAAKKTAAKRQPVAANKARTAAETKAADGGS
jgi:hypothetical protein